LIVTNEFLLLAMREEFNSPLAFHRGSLAGQFFHVHEPDGEAGARVTGAASAVVLLKSPLRVGGPTGVVGPIGAFEQIAEEAARRQGDGRGRNGHDTIFLKSKFSPQRPLRTPRKLQKISANSATQWSNSR